MNEECEPIAWPPPLNLLYLSSRMQSYGTMDDHRNGGSSDTIKEPEAGVSPQNTDGESITNVQKYEYDDSRKIGITGATFLILNKMIGTGSESIAMLSCCRPKWCRAC